MNDQLNPKKILSYGDSNTAGQMPVPVDDLDQLYSPDHIWTGILQEILGNEYKVINEGLAGRTATDISDASIKITKDTEQNGFVHFAPTIEKHLPINTLVLYLGTNDLKERFKRSASEISSGIEILIEELKRICEKYNVPLPEIIIISPTIVIESEVKPPYKMEGAQEKSYQLASNYQRIAHRNNCKFIDLSQVIHPSYKDGMHLELEGHEVVAELVADAILSEP